MCLLRGVTHGPERWKLFVRCACKHCPLKRQVGFGHDSLVLAITHPFSNRSCTVVAICITDGEPAAHPESPSEGWAKRGNLRPHGFHTEKNVKHGVNLQLSDRDSASNTWKPERSSITFATAARYTGSRIPLIST